MRKLMTVIACLFSASVLSGCGAQPPQAEATGPEEALALAEHVKPGLVLLNAKLAQERDYWLVRGLRQIPSEFEIFVLADAMSDAEGQAAMSRGASGYSETDKLPDILGRVRGRKDRP